LFDYKTAGQLGCVVFVSPYECIILSSDYDTLCWLLMRLYWPVFNKVVKNLYCTLYVHHSLERGLISESTKQFTNQDETKVALIFGKSNYFCISENENEHIKMSRLA